MTTDDRFAALREQLAVHRKYGARMMGVQLDEIAALLDAADGMNDDAERYRWLREAPPHSIRWTRWEIALYSKNGREPLYGPDLDAAIDIARAALDWMERK